MYRAPLQHNNGYIYVVIVLGFVLVIVITAARVRKEDADRKARAKKEDADRAERAAEREAYDKKVNTVLQATIEMTKEGKMPPEHTRAIFQQALVDKGVECDVQEMEE